jgi:PKD repeat protein
MVTAPVPLWSKPPNSAEDLLDENNDGVNDNAFPIPNVHEGWGRVNLTNATDGSHQFVEETNGLQTGEEFTYQFIVNSTITPFKVTLVWSDYPSTEAAYKHLINDLNLEITSPAGDSYLGNRFQDGWSITGGLPDKQNNVENVYVELPAAGTWTVKVQGYNVPNGPQPFALVVDGVDSNTPPQASFTANPISGEAPLTVTFDASASSDLDLDPFTYSWDFGDGSPLSPPSNDPTASYIYSDGGTYTVVLTVDDGNGGTGTASQVITVNTPGNNPPQALFTANPISGEAPLLVNFDASASSDPDGDSFTYDWDFGDGNSDTGLTVSNTSNTYSAGGTYTVVLTVDDGNGGTDTASQVITVTVNQSPVADAGADQNVIDTNGDGSESVTLDGSASYDPDGGAAAPLQVLSLLLAVTQSH